jgi:hypothetical protein
MNIDESNGLATRREMVMHMYYPKRGAYSHRSGEIYLVESGILAAISPPHR